MTTKSIIDTKSIAGSIIVAIICGAATFYVSTSVAKATIDVEIKNIKEDYQSHKDDSKRLVEEIMKTLKALESKAAVNESDHKNIEGMLKELKQDVKDLRS